MVRFKYLSDIEIGAAQFPSVREIAPKSLLFSVRRGHGKPGKSWNVRISFSKPGKSWKTKVLFGRLVTADDKARIM